MYKLFISILQDIFVVMQAADIDAVDVTITAMTNIVTVFDVVGEGTTAVLENIIISNNNIAQSKPSNLWTGINIRDNAIGTVTNISFLENSNVRHIFSASVSATMDIQRSTVIGASGGRVVVSQSEVCQQMITVALFCAFIMILLHHRFCVHSIE